MSIRSRSQSVPSSAEVRPKTGAERDYPGLIKAAERGTLFLDEIADADAGAQATLLRFLDKRLIRPVGSTEEEKVGDLVLVSATNKKPQEEITWGVFREDLYFRLAAVEIVVPPLCDRLDDIEGIAPALVAKLSDRYEHVPDLGAKAISRGAIRELQDFGENWTGNVRQLESVLGAAFINAGKRKCIEAAHLPPRERWHRKTRRADRATLRWELDEYLGKLTCDQVLREYAHVVLVRAEGNKRKAAETAGVAATTLYRWLAIPEQEGTPQSRKAKAEAAAEPANKRKKTAATGRRAMSPKVTTDNTV